MAQKENWELKRDIEQIVRNGILITESSADSHLIASVHVLRFVELLNIFP